MPTLSIGSISHGTRRTPDLASAVLAGLRELRHDDTTLLRDLETIAEHHDDDDELHLDWADECVDAGINALQAYAPPFCCVGMHAGDGSDFGVWPWHAALHDAIRDGELISINSLADLDSLSVAECEASYAVHVNDHGIMSLYRLTLAAESVWGIV